MSNICLTSALQKMPNDGCKKDDSCKQICWYLHFPRFRTIFGATFEKNTNFVTRLSRQAHDREICFNPAVAILRRTLHCGETARFLPPFFIGGTQHPLDLLTITVRDKPAA